MKKILLSLSLAGTFVFFSFLPADNCGMYVLAKEGTLLEQKSYNDKDKLSGTNKIKVVSVKGSEVQMEAESFDKKDKPLGKTSYAVVCEGDNFYVDMRSMVSQEQMANFKDMQFNITADRLDIPSNPKPGQELKGGKLEMISVSEGSPITMKLTIDITNRKVAALEEVTVPAGKFNCVKITYDAESKILFTVRSKMVEWYAKDVGLVKSETYSSKDKLMGYMVLASKQ